jgi:hypothetical protein
LAGFFIAVTESNGRQMLVRVVEQRNNSRNGLWNNPWNMHEYWGSSRCAVARLSATQQRNNLRNRLNPSGVFIAGR